MKKILELKMFIAPLPLSGFLCFRVKRFNLPGLSHLRILLCFVICMVMAASQFLNPPIAEADFNEQLAIDTRAISLANNVTADPPGIMSIHYNPAGLALLGDGNYISLGAVLPIIDKTVRVTKDPNFEGFHDLKGNLIEDPLWGTRNGPNRLSGNSWSGTEGSNTSGKMNIPFLDTIVDFLATPIFGLSHRNPGSKWTFAYSVYAPFGIGQNNGDKSDPARKDGQYSYWQHLTYASPSVSYQVNKTLSVGASLGLGASAIGACTDVRAPNAIVNLTKTLGDATQGMENPLFDLTIPMPLFGGGLGPYDSIGNLSMNLSDDFSPSFNLGVLWGPFDWLSFGISYQSAIKTHMSGKYQLTYSDQWQNMVEWCGKSALMQIVSMALDLPYQRAAEQTGTVTLDRELPQIVNWGIKLKPIKRLSLLADLHWANWSSFKQDSFVFDQKIQLLQLAKYMGYNGGDNILLLERHWEDTWNWGVGAEYQALDWLTLRAGYEKRTSSIPDITYDGFYPLPTLDNYGAGLGIKGSGLGIKMLRDIDIDLAVAYLVNKSYKITNNTSSNMNSNVLGSGIMNPYAGLNYEQETAAYIGSVKATMPLDVVTTALSKGMDMLNPFKRSASTNANLRTTENVTVDSPSPTAVDNFRVEGQSYYIENSD
ncbi:MAG: outer membrane protein transport protein [Smithella sp.]